MTMLKIILLVAFPPAIFAAESNDIIRVLTQGGPQGTTTTQKQKREEVIRRHKGERCLSRAMVSRSGAGTPASAPPSTRSARAPPQRRAIPQ